MNNGILKTVCEGVALMSLATAVVAIAIAFGA